MTGSIKAGPLLLEDVPVRARERILSGMRWTVWLSAASAPFSYLTTIFLARMGPAVIGTWGLLTLFISFTSSLLYLGGDSVTIRFAPLLPPSKRFSFLFSYLQLVLAALLLWAVAVVAFPQIPGLLLGEHTDQVFLRYAAWLAPIYIVRAVILAGLTSSLDIRLVQLLNRVLTIGTSAIFGVLYVALRSFLGLHYHSFIWLTYIFLSAATLVIGSCCLARHPDWRPGWPEIRFFLPRGFWRYLSSLEQASALSFLGGRLDVILVLHYGGLEMLGQYVAAISMASFLQIANRLICDPLLPALTNLHAARNTPGASAVFAMHLRLLFALNAAAVCGFLAFTDPIIRLLGPSYVHNRDLFALMIVSYGVAGPGSIAGTLMTSLGRQQISVWVTAVEVLFLLALFAVLWPSYGLIGAAAASGGAILAANLAMLIIARRKTPLQFRFGCEYFWLVLVTILTAILSLRLHFLSGITPFVIGTGGLLAFLLLARFRLEEIMSLISVFLPAGRHRWMSRRAVHE